MSPQKHNNVCKRKLKFELKLKDFELDDDETIAKKLLAVEEENELPENEIYKMVKRNVVRKENVLALVTLQGEKEKPNMPNGQESDQRAIIITETTSVSKLTRLKARELNNAPRLLMQSLPDASTQYETTALINDDLCSDEDDGEYLFQEEDFMSDDEPSMTTSDVESNPCTPLNTQTQHSDVENSPVKFTDDGCFKIPFERKDEPTDDMRISTRTRSKVCLEKVAIEDIESEFVPPDVEYLDVIDHDITANDTEWMEFLNEFSRPLNPSAFIEEDDPINDPEYVATEKVSVDAEELRSVNISKRELADLFAELLDDLGNEGILLDNIDFQPMQTSTNNPHTVDGLTTLTAPCSISTNDVLHIDTQENIGDHGNVSLCADPTLLAPTEATNISRKTPKLPDVQYSEGNATNKYISVRKSIYAVYYEKFHKNNNHIISQHNKSDVENNQHKFTSLQYELLQQQLRIHVQMLTQTFLQTYYRPDLWQLAPQAKNMLLELEKLAQRNHHLMPCNLPNSLALIKKWEDDLSVDNYENKQLMNFVHKEIDMSSINKRKAQRFPARLTELILNSNVFLYPQYLPRLPFSSKICSYHVFAPSENQLIAIGLQKHMEEITQSMENFPKRAEPLIVACAKLSGDTIFGKQKRRIWDHVKVMRKVPLYNPIKYFFEHNCAPPVEQKLLPFDMYSIKPPKDRYNELPTEWQKYILKKEKPLKSTPIKEKSRNDNVLNNYHDSLSPCNSIKSNKLYRKIKTNPFIASFENVKKKTKCRPRFKSAINKYNKLCYLKRYRTLKKRIKLSLSSPKRFRPELEQHIRKFIEKCKEQQEILEYPYTKTELILRVYRRFRALELYTSLLEELKMICTGETVVNKANCLNKRRRASGNQNATTSAGPQHSSEDDGSPAIRNKKSIRQEENFRHMLMPETPEDMNRKDAVFAYNFYERVEEIFTSENRLEDLKKFNEILNSFDPSHDKVADLFHSMEELFMPKHVELAEIFLTFLLPAEASEVGKFFEHFMINNVTTFISKLNIYFNKQPAQIKKIYNCLSELAAEPDVTLKKVEMKILPLLKGNQFLIDWFLAQFPNANPPERILPEVEHINMKEKYYDGEIYETVVDALYSPTNETSTSCQLRYINGRIYYGSKLTLPVKLSFLATHLNDKNNQKLNQANIDNDPEAKRQKLQKMRCVHGIREAGELCLAAEAHNETPPECLKEENLEIASNQQGTQSDLKATDHEEVLKEVKEESDYEVCDQNAMRAHAIRLNPQYYACFASTSSHAVGHLNSSGTTNSNVFGKKFYIEESGDISPRKKTMNSPTKKVKSPVAAARRPTPMVVIPKPNLAIACAKKLKSLVEHEDECKTIKLTNGDLGVHQVQSNIIARPKKITRPEGSTKTDVVEHHAAKSLTKSERLQQKNVDEQMPSKAVVKFAVDKKTNKADNEEEKISGSDNKSNANQAWLREEDKVILMEMRINSKDQTDLLERIHHKLTNRNLDEIRERFTFLMDFLSNLQRK